MLADSNFSENCNPDAPVEIFRKILKQFVHLFLSVNLSITVKSNEFVEKKYRTSRVNSWYIAVKKKKKKKRITLSGVSENM